jgi:hypothetical protein
LNRSVTVRLGSFASEALTGGHKHLTRPSIGVKPKPDDVLRAVRFYLDDKRSGVPGWAYPDFLREKHPGAEIEFELSIDSSLWRALKEEAKRQSVSVPQLLEHAALYYAAELDAGRVTERILEDLGQE